MVYTHTMARGTVRLKGRELLNRYDVTMYRVHKDGDLSYNTVQRLVKDDKKGFNADSLFSFLIGLGLSMEQIANLRMGEVFDLIPFEEAPTE